MVERFTTIPVFPELLCRIIIGGVMIGTTAFLALAFVVLTYDAFFRPERKGTTTGDKEP